MKVFLCVVLLSLALGAAAMKDGAHHAGGGQERSEVLTAEERSAMIVRLQAEVRKLEVAVNRFIRIGKTNVAKLESVMDAVDMRRRKCLQLETLRPGPVHVEQLPIVPIKPLDGDPFSLSQLSIRIHALDRYVTKMNDAINRFTSIGKNNIGVLQRFAAAARSSVCGDDHHSKCPVGFVHNSVTDSCFHEVVGNFKNFAQAQEKCHRRGGHLPLPRSADANNGLADLLQYGVRSPAEDAKAHALWIGARRNEAGIWQRIHHENDPEDLSAEDAYTNFATDVDEEGKDCAYLCTMSNKWIKVSCDTRTRILCERANNPEPAVDEDDEDEDDD